MIYAKYVTFGFDSWQMLDRFKPNVKLCLLPRSFRGSCNDEQKPEALFSYSFLNSSRVH